VRTTEQRIPAERGAPLSEDTGGSQPKEFAIRVTSVDDLFAPYDARPVAERPLAEEVRFHLLDAWEHVRTAHPAVLHCYAPASEREQVDEQALTTAVRRDMRAYTHGLRRAAPLSRRDRIAALVGISIFLLTIVVSTSLEQLTDDVFVAGISQGLVVIGWVALWVPAQRVVVDLVPHYFERSRYAELADIEVRLVWVGESGDQWRASEMFGQMANEPPGDRADDSAV